MKFFIKHQDSYSRGELLLRSFFGFFYILIPHLFVLTFLTIGLLFVDIIRFWAILITGKWPKNLFDYAVKMQRYNLRVSARILNLSDGYPKFGLNGTDDKTYFDIEYKEEYSRLRLLGRSIFGLLLLIPHILVLYIKIIGVYVILFIAWFAVLINGKYPKGMHHFMAGILHHGVRLRCYLYFLTDGYPEFGNTLTTAETSNFPDEIREIGVE